MGQGRRLGKDLAVAEALAVLVAAGMDMLGEPPPRWHPVVWYGWLIRLLESRAPERKRPRAQLCYGVIMLLFAVPVVLVPAVLIQELARWFGERVSSRVQVLFSGLLLGTAFKPLFALRMLVNAGKQVRQDLERDDLLAARDSLRSLVSRERAALDRELVAAAAIESLAENLSDSVVGPCFYYAIFGLPGAALYRLFNTFDSMIGYHGDYEYLGKAAARLDDLLNLLPARMTALLILLCAPLFVGDARQGWRIWRRDGVCTESPNAGQPMAAAAGALGIQLVKIGHYVLGDHERAIVTEDIRRAEQMVYWVGGLALLLSACVRWCRR